MDDKELNAVTAFLMNGSPFGRLNADEVKAGLRFLEENGYTIAVKAAAPLATTSASKPMAAASGLNTGQLSQPSMNAGSGQAQNALNTGMLKPTLEGHDPV